MFLVDLEHDRGEMHFGAINNRVPKCVTSRSGQDFQSGGADICLGVNLPTQKSVQKYQQNVYIYRQTIFCRQVGAAPAPFNYVTDVTPIMVVGSNTIFVSLLFYDATN